jgi:nanoRNase/pAp phosphatase (c-di-AMP/oligoRNAs hydrolase)
MQLVNPCTYEIDLAPTRERLEQLRQVVNGAERVALLLQDDPDPDGIASAIAMRTVLGRNRATTPLFSFGETTRVENLAMLRLLDVQIEPADSETLRTFACVALLDVQPAYFGERLPHAHIVIDHHPKAGPIDVEYCDLRTQYGATSTILTEYLEACEADVSQRLATALLYGIKSDTLMLNRETGPADLRAFMSLYPLTNYNVLRRIERPELPLSFAAFLARVLPRMHKQNGLLTLHVGTIDREAVIPQLADFCLQFENTEWVVVSGKWQGHLVMSVRNPGYVRSAGDVVRKLFVPVGRGGGHRSMAKAVIPLRRWRKAFGSTQDGAIASLIDSLFRQELYGNEQDEATASP